MKTSDNNAIPNGVKQPYLLTTKELVPDFGINSYDFGARMQDMQLGRWWSVDPKSEELENYSPYSYVRNNPTLRFDPDGMKDKPFNKNTDKPITIQPGTETPIIVKGYDKNGTAIVDSKSKTAYNCHSYAWEKGQGDPKDPKNKTLVAVGIKKWDNDPSNNIESQKAEQLNSSEPNKPGDRIIYFTDSNKDGKYEKGENIEHSAIVKSVDKEGNTTIVIGKMGQNGISENHPNAPGYYKYDEKNNPTSRAYFRLPEPQTINPQKKEKQ